MGNKFFSALAGALSVMMVFPSCSEEPLPKAEMPILAWFSIPANHTTLKNYQDLVDCGFNINFSHIHSLPELKKALDTAEVAGVKMLAMCDELYEDTENTVREIMDHPALYGYFLNDEPNCNHFAEAREIADRIKSVDDKHFLYLNLFPNYASEEMLGCPYREYVHRFIEEVGLPFVSFDFYAVTVEGIAQSWYDNLQVVADEAKAAGIPFWAFALSEAFEPYRETTPQTLRLQVYTDLAYGSQAIQYFTYWNSGEGLESPILDGRHTKSFDYVKSMNEEIQARAGVFLGSKVVELVHTGDSIPDNCKPLEAMPAHVKSLKTGSAGAIVSLLENGEWNYLVVVSRTLDEPLTLDVEFDEKACLVDREGNLVKVGKGLNSYSIEEGDAAIFRFKK